ncbi:transmembrane protein 272-like [Chaetodon trifascialis]|uniref:transmembrane protein 272-like n=1 Tax=Chaetodon trifascialis TaxID=109706 RepID=UPI0039938454
MSNIWIVERVRNFPQPPLPGLVLCVVFLCVIPIAEIAIVSVYLHDCPRERFIPICLIVVAVFSVVRTLLSCLPCTYEAEDAPFSQHSQALMFWNLMISFFLFCWFIVGNVWTYSSYQPNYNKTTTDVHPYCNRTLYLFSFWTMTMVYIVAISLVCSIIYSIYFCATGQTNGDDNV